MRLSVLLPFALLAFYPRLLLANEPIRISVEGDDDCLSAQRLSELVNEHLENETIPDDLSVTARLGESAGFSLYRHDVEIAERRFSALPGECDSIHSTFGVAIAIAVEHALSEAPPSSLNDGRPAEDPEAVLSSANASEAELPIDGTRGTRANNPEERAEPSVAFPEGTHPQENNQVILSAGGGILFELLPRTAAVWTAQVKLLTPRSFSVSGTFLYSARFTVPFEVGRARGRLLGGQLHGCFEPHSEPWNPAVCLGLGAGALHAKGQGIWEARTGDSAWLAASMRASVRRFLFKRVGAEASGEFFVNLWRTGVQDRDSGGQVENAAPVGAALLLGAFVVLG